MNKEIPGPVGKWVFGNALDVDTKYYHNTLWKWKEEFGKIYQFRILNKNVIVISDEDLMEKAMVIEELCHRPDNFANVLLYNGSGVVSANFTKQQRDLKKMVWEVLFETSSDAELTKLFDAELVEFVDSLNKEEDINIADTLTRSVARQMTSQFIGIRASEVHSTAVLNFLDATNALYQHGRELFLTMFPWLRYIPGPFRRVVNDLYAKQTKLVEMCMNDARRTHIQGDEHSILHRLFIRQKAENEKHGTNYITEENLYSCILEIHTASAVPISQYIVWAILSLVVNPELQDRIYQEIDRAGPIHQVSVKDLPYLQALVLESFRLYSMVMISLPHYVAKDTVVDGYTFKEGSLLLGSIFNLHHDEKMWVDPWVFRPERFLDEGGKLLAATSQPIKSLKIFGFGPRACKGQEMSMKTVQNYLMHLIYTYKIKPPRDSELPSLDPREYNTIIVLEMPPFACRFERRH